MANDITMVPVGKLEGSIPRRFMTDRDGRLAELMVIGSMTALVNRWGELMAKSYMMVPGGRWVAKNANHLVFLLFYVDASILDATIQGPSILFIGLSIYDLYDGVGVYLLISLDYGHRIVSIPFSNNTTIRRFNSLKY